MRPLRLHPFLCMKTHCLVALCPESPFPAKMCASTDRSYFTVCGNCSADHRVDGSVFWNDKFLMQMFMFNCTAALVEIQAYNGSLPRVDRWKTNICAAAYIYGDGASINSHTRNRGTRLSDVLAMLSDTCPIARSRSVVDAAEPVYKLA
ncbi:hypothetical protein AcW1_008834 [Taiwanofungus camphoratus]|nr:hypothetical protein AcW1_008834 [Antrodia cinnamomea]